jgi:hypothetical protein
MGSIVKKYIVYSGFIILPDLGYTRFRKPHLLGGKPEKEIQW